jgi:hypothetical protein
MDTMKLKQMLQTVVVYFCVFCSTTALIERKMFALKGVLARDWYDWLFEGWSAVSLSHSCSELEYGRKDGLKRPAN